MKHYDPLVEMAKKVKTVPCQKESISVVAQSLTTGLSCLQLIASMEREFFDLSKKSTTLSVICCD
jgi:adenylosuccinate lyase